MVEMLAGINFLSSEILAPFKLKNSMFAMPVIGDVIFKLNCLLNGFGKAITDSFWIFDSSAGVGFVTSAGAKGIVAVRILHPSNALLIVATASCTSSGGNEVFAPP